LVISVLHIWSLNKIAFAAISFTHRKLSEQQYRSIYLALALWKSPPGTFYSVEAKNSEPVGVPANAVCGASS
jgi:hypothetical protein